MAENEILDIKGARRWRLTRAMLADSNASEDMLAESFLQDIDRGLRNSLSKTFRSGATLLTLLRAASESQASLRAVVSSFQDRQLASLFTTAIKVCGANDPAAVGRYAGQLIMDQVLEKTLLYARSFDHYAAAEQRSALARALSGKLESYKPQLMQIIDTSMQGQRVRGAPRPRKAGESHAVAARSLLQTSLRASSGGHQDAFRH
jgi:phytoene dehydrogenase-like protein